MPVRRRATARPGVFPGGGGSGPRPRCAQPGGGATPRPGLFSQAIHSECLGWAKYRVEEMAALTQEVEAFLDRYHCHRPPLAFDPMRPPLMRG